MKMKKILSVILSASMLTAAMSLPALADDNEIELFSYTKSEYDVVIQDINYNNDSAATDTNTIDNSKAMIFPAMAEDKTATRVFSFDNGNTRFLNEFYLSFDFKLNTESGAVPGVIGIGRGDDSAGRNFKQGPRFYYDGGKLMNATSKSPQDLGEISADTWYSAELEGKMVVSGANVVFNLYKYVGSEKTLVKTTESLNLRQFDSGASNGNPNHMYASQASIDNVKFISEYPNSMDVTAVSNEINAGSTTALDYVLKRNGTETAKYPVTWSVYNEDNTTEITDGSVSITTDGILSAKISSPTQKVTVRATTDLEGKNLVGTTQVKINAVDTGNEKFDVITISGESKIKAGTEATYTITATKLGEDVTNTLTEDDVVWTVYDYADLNPNGNKAINVSNGVLTIDDSVIAQKITLRASSKSGNVYASFPVEIGFSDKQVETVLYSNACEETADSMKKVDSWDGSTAYKATSSVKLSEFGNKTEYVLTELDIKFTTEGSGFTFDSTNGTINSCFRYHNNNISMQTGDNKYTDLMSADSDKWYHLEVLYFAGTDASCNIYEYNADGTLGEPRAFTNISRRNDKAYGVLQIEGGSIVDNIKISTPQANAIELKATSNKMYSGDTNQITATVSRNGLPLKGDAALEWALLDSNGKYILDGPVKIDGTGLITTTQMAPTQTITVEVKSGGFTETLTIDIELIEPFGVTNIGINETKDKIVKLYVNKQSGYNDDVLFIVAIYDKDHVLKGFKSVAAEGKSYGMGEQEVNFDFNLTDINFDSENDIITAFVWTRF